MARRPIVALCVGGDCRRAKGAGALRRALGGRCEIVDVRCLGVCDGPVAVVRPTSATPVIVARVRGEERRRALRRVVRRDHDLPGRLARREVTGAKRAKALRRLRRSLPRP